MTWLSRLLPPTYNFQRLAKDKNRYRQIQRRRRSMNLELLETRTVLSNVTISMATPSSPLVITGDVSNDNFIITEGTAASGGKVTITPGPVKVVPGVGVVPGSTINGSSAPFTTLGAVSSINVVLPGTTNFDFVTLTGQVANATTTVKNVTVTAGTGANLTFIASGVNNAGNLVVTDQASPVAPAQSVNGVLTATVSNSTFTTLSITQVGGGPDSSSVTLTGDSVASNVVVSEGTANGDKISLASNSFGATVLLQGNGGPSNANSLGNSDTVSVTGGSYKSLSVDQLLNGNSDSISISSIAISAINPTASQIVDGVPGVFLNGVWTKQGNGAKDSTVISGVTTSSPAPPVNQPLPPTIGLSNITVIQGTGASDSASVSTSSVPGSISISQSDLASNSPAYDTALISGDTAGKTISITQGNAGGVLILGIPTLGDQATVTKSTSGGNTTVTQGSGSNDSATVSLSTIGGNLLITQADLATNIAGDTASVLTDSVTGNVTISQGAASDDTATIDPTIIGGNATITQGNGTSDSATISDVLIGGDASISQGNGSDDEASIEGAAVGGSASITQGAGSGDFAVIDIALVGDDATITQGSGDGDYAGIGLGIFGGDADVTQGDGSGDYAIIGYGTFGGDVVISQGNGDGDDAVIADVTATGGDTLAVPSISISISQGSGSGDSATIDGVTAPGGNVSIAQGDVAGGLGDTAYVTDVSAGTTTGSPDAPVDVNGYVTITQGDAPGDIALVQGSSINNIFILQGDSVQVLNGSTIASDIAEVNDTTVTSDIYIFQGSGFSDADDSGNYVAAIGFDYLGLLGLNPQGTGSGSVSAGGSTVISQEYANNQVYLGDSESSFTTTFLDVYTGAGGGAFVFAENTTVFFGPLGYFSPFFTIEGGGSGNTYYDAGGNSGVTVDPDNFNFF